MSETLKKLLEDKVGYRTENFSGSGVRNAVEVATFEISSLFNTDIMDTMQNMYNLDFSEFIDVEEEDLFEVSQCILDKIFSFLEEKMEIPIQDMKAIWLTTEEYVKTRYCRDENCVIEKIEIGNSWIPISDLDKDGALFVYCDYLY